MPEFQPVASARVASIKRPGCSNCQHSRMLLSKLVAGSSGVEYRTFECQKCGVVRSLAVPTNPMRPSTIWGWLASGLNKPT